MRRNIGWPCLSAILLTTILLVPNSARAQDAPATVSGWVEAEGGERLAGARISLVGAGLEASTDADGEFQFENVPPGTYTLVIRVIGMPPTQAEIRLRPGERFEAEVIIPAQLPTLPEVVVEAERRRLPSYLREFYERRDVGTGFFITRADIEKRTPAVVSNMFRSIPRVRLNRNRSGRYDVQVIGTKCMLYFLNGARFTIGPLGIDEFSPDQIEGIEVYRGVTETPSRFNISGQGCGVVVIWTRI